MAVPPLAATDGEHTVIKHPDSRIPMDVNAAHMGPGGDLDTNGAPHPADDRVVSNGDGAGYPAPDSANGADGAVVPARADSVQRGEKIIKVLSWSLLCVLFQPLPLLSLISRRRSLPLGCPTPCSLLVSFPPRVRVSYCTTLISRGRSVPCSP